MNRLADSLILSFVALRLFHGKILRGISETGLFALIVFALAARHPER